VHRLPARLVPVLTEAVRNAGLDVTDIGRDAIRFAGTATHVPGHPPADEVPAYLGKYVERIAAIFGTPEQFARAFSEAIVITPTRLHA
jgi:hypothetical protein